MERESPQRHCRYTDKINAILSSSCPPLNITVAPSSIESLIPAIAADVASPHRLQQANSILTRLRSLNPSVASSFHPKQDALSNLTVRVIVPNSNGNPHASTTPITSFLAISYCWHSPEWQVARCPPADIAPGWKISRPMVEAITTFLRPASSDGAEGIWIDQICINQDDEAEKKLHLGAMDVIYRSARRLIILLEDVQLSAEEQAAGVLYQQWYLAMCAEVREKGLKGREKVNFVDRYMPSREQEVNASGNAGVLSGGRDFAIKVAGARWFSRAWCVHEVRVVPHRPIDNPVLLMFGSNGEVLGFEFRFLGFFFQYLTDCEADEDGPAPEKLQQENRKIQLLSYVNDPEGKFSIMQHLASILSADCLHKRDLISITLNSARVPLYYDGDMDTVGDVVWITSLLTIASGDVAPLVADGRKLRIKDFNGTETISWAIYPTRSVLQDKMPLLLPESITSVNQEYIELDLLLFTSLPTTASPEASEVASKIIRDHGLRALANEVAEEVNDHLTQTLSKLQLVADEVNDGGFVQAWLALSLDCGIDWILRFPDAMKAETEGVWYLGTLGDRADARLTKAASSLLAHFQVSDDGVHLEQAIRFLSCILDWRLVSCSPAPRRIPTGPELGDFAITSRGTSRSWIAVPAAIAHLPSDVQRAWVLEPFDPEVCGDAENLLDFLPLSDYADKRGQRDDGRASWRLRRQQEIFGCGPWEMKRLLAASEGGAAVKLKRQRVHGAGDYDWGAIAAAAQSAKQAALPTGALGR